MAAPPTPATPAAQALLDALADHPGATASELVQAAGIGRSTATKLLATLAADGQVLRQPGGLTDGRRAPDRWTLPAPASTKDPEASSTTATASAASAAQPPAGSGRLRPGALRDLVLACLAERPGQALSHRHRHDPGPVGRRGRQRPAGAGRPGRGGADPGQAPPLHHRPRGQRPGQADTSS